MPIHHVRDLFNPRSLAIVGASMRAGSAGHALYENVIAGGFPGELTLVNPRHSDIDGRACVPRLRDLTAPPDLVVIVAPPDAVLDSARDAAVLGAAAAIVVTPDPGGRDGQMTKSLRSIAQISGMRIIGPNCLGLMVPSKGLDVSLAAQPVAKGDLAVISQSGAVASALIAWANARNVGFSGLVSVDGMADVDFADLLDHFAMDESTRAILMYVDELNDVQAFMSAARAASRAKPVIVIKSGRHKRGPRGGTHSAALAGPDAVYDAAFRRAGLLRVGDIDELFDAAEAFGRIKPFPGRKLAIIANGEGIGRLAADRLIDLGGLLSSFSEATRSSLKQSLPPGAVVDNPIDVAGDADPDRMARTLELVLADKGTNAAIVMHSPTALSRTLDVARAVAETVTRVRARAVVPKPVFAVWFGATPETDAIFEQARIPHYTRGAVDGFMHLVRWSDAREFLMSAPPSLPQDFAPDAARARKIIAGALVEKRRWLTAEESAQLLDAYSIPMAPARFARGPEEAAELARLFIAQSGSCVVKIASPDIEHKSDVGGIALDLKSVEAVAEATRVMLIRVTESAPHARIDGVTVHPMVKRPHARELLAGLADDPTFGPVVVFGRGGKAVEVIDDRALALPPLDLSLAHDLIRRTRVSRILEDYGDVPRADVNAVALTLVKIAQLAADIPEIREIDLNPLLADENGVISVDTRIGIAEAEALRPGETNSRFAVAPYPKEQESRFSLRDGTPIFIRPVRPEDEDTYKVFFETLPQEDLRLRFFAPVKVFTHAFLARLTQIDYARAYAIAAFHAETGAMLGGVRLLLDHEKSHGEYAVLVSPAVKGHGLGYALMTRMIGYARAKGLEKVDGFVLTENEPMLKMCRDLGFEMRNDPQERGVMSVALDLSKETGAAS